MRSCDGPQPQNEPDKYRIADMAADGRTPHPKRMMPRDMWTRWGAAPWVLALLATTGCRDGATATRGDPDETDGAATDDAPADDDADDGPDDSDDSGSDGTADTGDTTDPNIEYLRPVDHLVRISMALRGVRPSIADIEAVEANADVLPELVDSYLEDERFGEVIRDVHDDALHVGIELKFAAFPPLDAYIPLVVTTSAMQLPLRTAEYIVRNDLPYTELVTGDYTVVDEIAATVWGWPYDPQGETWQVVTMDDRPAAGILAESSLFMRYESAGANYNRGRANAITTALLCHDFQSLDIEVDGVDLSDPDAVNEAVTELPECSGCHHTLDPIASNLFGHFPKFNNMQFDQFPLPSGYFPATEDQWENTNEREPGYFGTPTSGLADLGQQIADDPRFAQCAAMRFYGYFNQTPWQEVPVQARAVLQETLVDSGWNIKAMVRQIVLDDDFRIARGLDAPTAQEVIGLKKARPFQLASLMQDLTGFVWQLDAAVIPGAGGIGVLDLARSATVGFKVLGGAGDSLTVLETANTVNATTSLFLRQFATEAASFVVEQDFGRAPEDRRLLGLVQPDQADEAAVRDQLVWLHLRLFAQRVDADDDQVDAIYAVFSAVHQATGDTERAWKATLTALLQDFSILYY